MKTIFKTMTSLKLARQKQIQFEQKTGLKWDVYSTGQGMIFTPIITKETPVDHELGNLLYPKLSTSKYQDFVTIAKNTGLDLSSVLIGAKTLVMERRALGSVNRMSNFAGIKAKKG